MKVITAESTIAEVVRECPSARRIFDQHGLRGCGGQQGPAESLAFFADVHQADLAALLRELNAELKCPARDYRYEESLADFIYRRFFRAGIAIAITLGVLWGAINLLQTLLVRQLGIFSYPALTDRTFKFIRTAYVWLLVSCFMLPFYLLYGKFTGQQFSHAYMGAHRHAFTVGFISFMIMGVASRVVPILAGVAGDRFSSLFGPFILLNIGCAGRVLLQIATDFTRRAYPLIGVTGFVELVALTWWGIEMWRTMGLAQANRAGVLGAPRIQSDDLIRIGP